MLRWSGWVANPVAFSRFPSYHPDFGNNRLSNAGGGHFNVSESTPNGCISELRARRRLGYPETL